MNEGYTTRMATIEDAETITGHRRVMFEDMNMTVPDMAMTVFVDWVREKLANGDYLGWFITREDGEVIAGAGLWLIEWPPTPIDVSTTRGYVLNVFVEAEYRHQGLAKRLMETILAHCKQRQIHVVILHASSKGRPLYESLGFRGTNEMRIILPSP
jgi:GNAT superfamily N-acetyltransferase